MYSKLSLGRYKPSFTVIFISLQQQISKSIKCYLQQTTNWKYTFPNIIFQYYCSHSNAIFHKVITLSKPGTLHGVVLKYILPKCQLPKGLLPKCLLPDCLFLKGLLFHNVYSQYVYCAKMSTPKMSIW